ncbi:phosphatidate cytidylyltransferase [Bacillus lacus]|uniref:Phosphatidate cytidylyltransferase n=1 Tax=Metabacillus lacus TaxID=1983721 RepID=A0A7X2LVP2_9BACI|nr:phosphatidate cytidylyltransferase [Metabacillus lacus]MRX70625.1 phosphatidate cytidylyltransferase [Metabacillus lacus]
MKQRILTGIIAAALFLPIVLYGNISFLLMVYLLASISLYELLRMKKINLFSFPGFVSLLTLWVLLIPNSHIILMDNINISKVEFALLAILLFLTYTVATKNRFSFDDVGFVLLATMYIGIGFFYLIETRNLGLEYIFYALIVIWVTDSGAYFIGKSFGKRKLWPDISPNKTVEGSAGGILCAVLAAIIFQFFTGMEDSYIKLIVITILLSVFGQVGDLVESALKRQYQVKDSGHILPGHGGLLDRFDSLLFVLPILHFLIILL